MSALSDTLAYSVAEALSRRLRGHALVRSTSPTLQVAAILADAEMKGFLGFSFMASGKTPVTRALISVFDKTGIEDLAADLHAAGVEIVSTGSTAKYIEDAGIPVTPIEAVTGFAECLDGRVKTLHPAVHAGILADMGEPSHVEALEQLSIQPFQLVIVNLYPFEKTVASGAADPECIEKIDIGGPTMVRAAAKNHASVAVIVDPTRYAEVARSVAEGGFTLAQRQEFAAEAFQHTAAYDVAVAMWMTSRIDEDESRFPEFLAKCRRRAVTLRYGENPHQAAALYRDPDGVGIAQAEQLHGKEMSYNNYVDADAAWRAAWDHERCCVAVIKHANPCGIAIDADEDVARAHRSAHACDPVSAFGGVIATNRDVSVEMANQISEVFTEVVIAPGYEDGALEILTRKKNIRILRASEPEREGLELKQISGGLLVQEKDVIDAPGDKPAEWKLVAGQPADGKILSDLKFAWRTVRSVKSNAILLAHDGATVGVGMGQVNRVDAAKLAVERAGADRVEGSVAASDAFFPFADGFDVLAEAGVVAVVQPGGSIRDEEVIAAAKKAGVTMYFTGARHFYH